MQYYSYGGRCRVGTTGTENYRPGLSVKEPVPNRPGLKVHFSYTLHVAFYVRKPRVHAIFKHQSMLSINSLFFLHASVDLVSLGNVSESKVQV